MNKILLLMVYLSIFVILGFCAFGALSDNLVAYYSFDANSTNLTDDHGNYTAAGSGTEGDEYYASGKVNAAYDLDGTNDYYSTGTSQWFDGTGAFSFSFWFNQTGSNNTKVVDKAGGDATNRWGINIGWNGVVSGPEDGSFNLFTRESSSSNLVYNETDLSDGSWHHIVLSRGAGANCTLFVDGVNVSSDLLGSCQSGDIQQASIGHYIGSTQAVGAYWNGSLDEIGFWTRALTLAEITDLYNSGTGLTYSQVNDTSAPTVTLNGPVEGNSTTAGVIDFNFTCTDANAINATLFINGVSNATNASVTNNTATIIQSTSLAAGDYNWTVQCCDSLGNCANGTYSHGWQTLLNDTFSTNTTSNYEKQISSNNGKFDWVSGYINITWDAESGKDDYFVYNLSSTHGLDINFSDVWINATFDYNLTTAPSNSWSYFGLYSTDGLDSHIDDLIHIQINGDTKDAAVRLWNQSAGNTWFGGYVGSGAYTKLRFNTELNNGTVTARFYNISNISSPTLFNTTVSSDLSSHPMSYLNYIGIRNWAGATDTGQATGKLDKMQIKYYNSSTRAYRTITLTGGSNTAPTITLNQYTANVSTDYSNYTNLKFNATITDDDAGDSSNCSFIYNGAKVQNYTNVINNSVINRTQTATQHSTVAWYWSCNDGDDETNSTTYYTTYTNTAPSYYGTALANISVNYANYTEVAIFSGYYANDSDGDQVQCAYFINNSYDASFAYQNVPYLLEYNYTGMSKHTTVSYYINCTDAYSGENKTAQNTYYISYENSASNITLDNYGSNITIGANNNTNIKWNMTWEDLDGDTGNCSFLFNAAKVYNVTGVLNNSVLNHTRTISATGTYAFFWNCYDSQGTETNSTTYYAIADLTAPSIQNISINPNLLATYFGDYNITVDVTDVNSISQVNLTYKPINGDGNSCFQYYVNGSCAKNTNTTISLTNGTGNQWYSSTIKPDDIYPQIEFVNDSIFWNNPINNYDIKKSNYYIFEFTNNFTMIQNATFFIEFDAVNKSATNRNLEVYVFDRNTTITDFQSSWLSSSKGELVQTFNINNVKNHTHTTNSSHHLVTLVAVQNGLIGTKTLNVTDKFWVVLYTTATATNKEWSLRYRNSSVCNSSNWYSGNANTWATTAITEGCPDVHVHIIRDDALSINDGINMTVTALDAYSNTNTTSNQEYFGQIGNLAPLPNAILTPIINTTYNCNLNITWNAFIDPNNDTINYTVELLNSDSTFNSTLASDVQNTFYNWNCAGISDGTYQMRVNGSDGSLQSYTEMGGNWTLDNTSPTVTLVTPNGAMNNTINFTFNCNEAGTAQLFINSTANGSTTSVVADTNTSFLRNITTLGNYTWNVQCTDGAGNAANATADYNLTVAASCGNDVLETGETCDTNQLNGNTCQSSGYSAGTISCSATCTLDLTACTNTASSSGSGGSSNTNDYDVLEEQGYYIDENNILKTIGGQTYNVATFGEKLNIMFEKFQPWIWMSLAVIIFAIFMFARKK